MRFDCATRIVAIAGISALAAWVATPVGSADFDNRGRFIVQVPGLLCEIESDPNSVVCQGRFPQAPPLTYCGSVGQRCATPMFDDQAVVTKTGDFNYRNANIGVGDGPALNTLLPGQTVSVRGWTVSGTHTQTSLINVETNHGMTIHQDGSVDHF